MPLFRKRISTLGSKEVVSFPELGFADVPAKVDTGADSSAIWASRAVVNAQGELSFTLFAPGNRFYTGKELLTTEFKRTSVKNSSGDREFRYKVRLLVRLDGRKIRAWFNLADRSSMRYPVLLGRRLLHGKFVVDVAHERSASPETGMADIAVVGVKLDETRQFYEEVARKSTVHARFTCVDYDTLMFVMDSKHVHIVDIVHDNRDMASYNMAYFKSHVLRAEQAAAVAEYLRFHNVYFVDRDVAGHASSGKLSEYMKLSCHGLPVPLSIAATVPLLADKYDDIVAELGAPFVLKDAESNRGKNNFLIADEPTFREVIAAASRRQVFVAQKFIPNDGFYRLYVLGRNVEMAVWRAGYPHEEARKAHLNKPAGGPNASLVDVDKLPADMQGLAVRAADCMDRQIAGVDILQDNLTKKWYILEVNNAPQVRSGSFVEEKADVIARYFDNALRRNV